MQLDESEATKSKGKTHQLIAREQECVHIPHGHESSWYGHHGSVHMTNTPEWEKRQSLMAISTLLSRWL